MIEDLHIEIDVIIRQLNRQQSQIETSISKLNRLKNKLMEKG